MNIQELIKNINSVENQYSIVFAKRIDNEFTKDSEIIITEIDEEAEEDICEIMLEKNPEFEYFLEVFLIKGIVEDLATDFSNIDQVIDRLIHYVEYDG